MNAKSIGLVVLGFIAFFVVIFAVGLATGMVNIGLTRTIGVGQANADRQVYVSTNGYTHSELLNLSNGCAALDKTPGADNSGVYSKIRMQTSDLNPQVVQSQDPGDVGCYDTAQEGGN